MINKSTQTVSKKKMNRQDLWGVIKRHSFGVREEALKYMLKEWKMYSVK